MTVQELDIRCPHERNLKLITTVTYTDYHPLTHSQLVELLEIASTADSVDVSRIQVRLDQAMPDMVCPRPIDGEVGKKINKLDTIFIRAIKERKLTHPVVIDKLWKLIRKET